MSKNIYFTEKKSITVYLLFRITHKNSYKVFLISRKTNKAENSQVLFGNKKT